MNVCDICKEKFKEFPNSPRPIFDEGKCCNRCDDLIVTVARMIEAIDVKCGQTVTANIRQAIQMREGKRQVVAEYRKQQKRAKP